MDGLGSRYRVGYQGCLDTVTFPHNRHNDLSDAGAQMRMVIAPDQHALTPDIR